MRPADLSCANDPEPFGNCPARDRSRKSRADAVSPDIPAAYPQTRRLERSMDLRMSEDLRQKSRGSPFKGGTGWRRALRGSRAPAWTVSISAKMRGYGPAMVVVRSIFWQV